MVNGNSKYNIPEELLKYLVNECYLSDKRIAEFFGCSVGNIRDKTLRIKDNDSFRANKNPHRDHAISVLYKNSWGLHSIGKAFRLTDKTIRRILTEAGDIE